MKLRSIHILQDNKSSELKSRPRTSKKALYNLPGYEYLLPSSMYSLVKSWSQTLFYQELDCYRAKNTCLELFSLHDQAKHIGKGIQ